MKTTIRTQAADRITEWRQAHNELAIAIASYAKYKGDSDWKRVEEARAWVERLEKEHREARTALLEAQCEKQPGYKKRRQPWNIRLGKLLRL